MPQAARTAPRLGVIILNYGRPADTLACARAVLAQNPPLLALVDNASPDDSAALLASFGRGQGSFCQIQAQNAAEAAQKAAALPTSPRILQICAAQNRGYAAGNNLGLAAALALGCDACWILNNDALPLEGALGAIEESLAGAPASAGLFGTLVLNGQNGLVQCMAGGHTNYWSGLSRQFGNGLPREQARAIAQKRVEEAINYICGASVIATRKFLESAGLMDEGFFLYCEEQDWALRGQKLGFSLGYVPGAAVIHNEGSTTGMSQARRPPALMLRLARSRLRLTAKHKPLALPAVAGGLAFALLRVFWRRCAGHFEKLFAKRM